MLLWLLTACLAVSSRPACDIVDMVQVADDDETPLGTPAELLSRVAWDGPIEAEGPSGSAVDTELTIESSGASATWIVQEATSIDSRRFGIGRTELSLAPDCSDVLTVPLVGRVEAAAEGVVIEGLAGDVQLSSGVRALPGVRVDLKGAFADATFPESELDPADYDSLETFLYVQYQQGAITFGNAGWTGYLEDGADSHLALGFGL